MYVIPTITIAIPGIAYEDAYESIEEQSHEVEAPRIQVEAFEAWNKAVTEKRGSAVAEKVTAPLSVWNFLRGEMLYRWEVNGGNGNPYGLEDLAHYRRARESCKRALDRIDNALAVARLSEAEDWVDEHIDDDPLAWIAPAVEAGVKRMSQARPTR